MVHLGIEESEAARAPDAAPKQRFDFLRCLYDRTNGSDAVPIYIEEIVEELGLAEAEAETILQSLADKDLIQLRLHCIVSITQAGIDEVKTALEPPPVPTGQTAGQIAVQTAGQIAVEAAGQAADHTAAIETLGAQLLGVLHTKPDSPSADPQALPSRFIDTNKDSDELVALELKNICEAIGLDPEAFNKEVAAAGSARANERKIASYEPAVAARAEMSFFQANDLPDILASLKIRLLKIRLSADDIAEAEAEIATAIAQLLSPRPKLQIIAAALNTLLSILEKAGTAALTSDIEMSLVRIRFFLTQLAL
jgi:hypothetical protein